MKQIIKRKDGIEYERRVDDIQCDSRLNIRINSDTLNELKIICTGKGIKYSDLVRTLIEEYIGEEKYGNNRR